MGSQEVNTLTSSRLVIITSMQVTFDIPDTLAAQLTAAGKDPARAALEALVVEGYRTDKLSEGEIRDMLGYQTPMQVHELLQQHGAHIHYSLEDFEQDKQTLSDLQREASTAA